MMIAPRRTLVLAAVAACAFAHAYDAATDFSLASNPNGVWSYGYATSLTGSFILDTDTSTSGPVQQWRGDLAGDGNPGVYKNTSSNDYQPSTAVYPANGMVMHPGPDGEYCVVRFTAPSAGLYAFSANFTGEDVQGTTTDVHVLGGGTSLFDGTINGYRDATSYGSTIALAAGGTLDLRVGYGSNGTFFNDSTGTDLAVRLMPTPEPATFAALGLGTAVIIRRRRKA